MTDSATSPLNSAGSGLTRGSKRLVPLIVLTLALGLAAAAILAPATRPGNSAAAAAAAVVPAKVIRAYPHDPAAFCQGLAFNESQLYEGTGQYGRSRLLKVNLETGAAEQEVRLADNVFGEGIAVWNNQIIQLTWKNGYLLVYDAATLQLQGTVAYRDIDRSLREGWGLTHDGTHLILSDGSSTLRFIDPATWKVVRTLRVKSGFRSVSQLNELEFINDEIFANVWYRDQIARIDPQTGQVNSWLDLSAVRPRAVQRNREAVLNGIAWDADQQRLFVTGKHWPTLFEIRYVASPE